MHFLRPATKTFLCQLNRQSDFGPSYRRNRLTLGEKVISKHFWQGHLNAVSSGKMMWPQFSQICRPLGRTFIALNPESKTQ